MGFNLYFAGSLSNDVNKEIRESDKLRLLSYYSEHSEIQRYIKDGKTLFLDSGAYSAYTRGAVIDVDKYIKYINEHDESFEKFAQLDVINNGEESLKNFEYMRTRVKSPQKLVPVYHLQSPISYLTELLKYDITYLGVGGLAKASYSRRKVFLQKVFKEIRKSGKDVKVHAFGITDFSILEKFPFYSADSTTWIMTGVNGQILSDRGRLFISNRMKRYNQYIFNQSNEVIEYVTDYIKKAGYTVEELETNVYKRELFNVDYMQDLANRYEYKGNKKNQKTLF